MVSSTRFSMITSRSSLLSLTSRVLKLAPYDWRTIAIKEHPRSPGIDVEFLMRSYNWRETVLLVLLATISLSALSCNFASKDEPFFGKTVPPERNVFRYVTGDEPESLDPVVITGEPEARIYMALYDGLVEYHPKTL